MVRNRTLAPALMAGFTLSLLGFVHVGRGVQRASGEAFTLLEQAKQFELISLYPDPAKKEFHDRFHGWTVSGKTSVKEAQTRKRLVDALKKGIEEVDGIGRGLCFEPRHGIRVTYQEKTADFLICFHCAQVRIFMGESVAPLQDFKISKSPEPVFDQVLSAAGIPLAAKASKN